jgi:hypothetical protein
LLTVLTVLMVLTVLTVLTVADGQMRAPSFSQNFHQSSPS